MKLLTTKQVAEILQVTPARVYEMSRLKLLPVVKLGRQIRFNEEVRPLGLEPRTNGLKGRCSTN